jgi:hypothetical protein
MIPTAQPTLSSRPIPSASQEDLGDLPDGHVEPVVQDDRRPLPWRESAEHVENLSEFVLSWRIRIYLWRRTPALTPQLLVRQSERDPVQPGTGVPDAVGPLQVPSEGLRNDLLRQLAPARVHEESSPEIAPGVAKQPIEPVRPEFLRLGGSIRRHGVPLYEKERRARFEVYLRSSLLVAESLFCAPRTTRNVISL